MGIALGEYRGYPTITLVDDDEIKDEKPLAITFGVRKVKLILKNIAELQSFVDRLKVD